MYIVLEAWGHWLFDDDFVNDFAHAEFLSGLLGNADAHGLHLAVTCLFLDYDANAGGLLGLRVD